MVDAADAAFRDALARLIPALRGYARALARSHDAADDLVQEAILRALAAERQFIPQSDLRAWVFTILRHAWLGGLRRGGREARAHEGWRQEVISEGSIGAGDAADARLGLNRLAVAMRSLPPLQREALLLVGAQGLAAAEAARIAGVAEGTIRARVSRARAALKRALVAVPGTQAILADHH
jgi:RNA polymerase sigma-70 factor (ECF subfamily)